MNRDDYMLEKINERHNTFNEHTNHLKIPLMPLTNVEMSDLINSIEKYVIDHIDNNSTVLIHVLHLYCSDDPYVDPIFIKCTKFYSWVINYRKLMDDVCNSNTQSTFSRIWLICETKKFLKLITDEWNKTHNKFIMSFYDYSFRITLK